VQAAAAANVTCAANPRRLVAAAGAAAVALPATAAAPQDRRRCAAFPRGFGAGEWAAGKGAYPAAARAPAPTDAVVQPAEEAADRGTARCAAATSAAYRGAGCRAAGAAPPSFAATPRSSFPAAAGWSATSSGAPGVFDPPLVAAVGAAAVAAVPVDRAAGIATDGDGVHPRLFAHAHNAAATSSAPASASTEAPMASRPPALAEAGTHAAPAQGATIMPPLAGVLCGGCGGDTTRPSPVTAGRSSFLSGAALRAARRPVAGVVAAEAAWRPLLAKGVVPGRAMPWLLHRTPPPRRRASLVAALWADGHWVLEGGVPTLRTPPTATSAAAPPDSALQDAAWQPAAAVAMAAAAALPAQLAVGTAADGHTSPCLSATARAAAAATPATWPAREAAPAARPLVGTPPLACRQPAPSIGADVRSPLPFPYS